MCGQGRERVRADRARRSPSAKERRLLFRDRDAATKERNCIKAAVINIFRDSRRVVSRKRRVFSRPEHRRSFLSSFSLQSCNMTSITSFDYLISSVSRAHIHIARNFILIIPGAFHSAPVRFSRSDNDRTRISEIPFAHEHVRRCVA